MACPQMESQVGVQGSWKFPKPRSLVVQTTLNPKCHRPRLSWGAEYSWSRGAILSGGSGAQAGLQGERD